MPADESLDQQPISLLPTLAARYPGWTIWFGQATRHWWALPPHDRDGDRFDRGIQREGARRVDQVIQARRRMSAPSPQPGGILFGEAETSRAGRVPAAAWPGGRR